MKRRTIAAAVLVALALSSCSQDNGKADSKTEEKPQNVETHKYAIDGRETSGNPILWVGETGMNRAQAIDATTAFDVAKPADNVVARPSRKLMRQHTLEERAILDTMRRVKNGQDVSFVAGDLFAFGMYDAEEIDVMSSMNSFRHPIIYFERSPSGKVSAVLLRHYRSDHSPAEEVPFNMFSNEHGETSYRSVASEHSSTAGRDVQMRSQWLAQAFSGSCPKRMSANCVYASSLPNERRFSGHALVIFRKTTARVERYTYHDGKLSYISGGLAVAIPSVVGSYTEIGDFVGDDTGNLEAGREYYDLRESGAGVYGASDLLKLPTYKLPS